MAGVHALTDVTGFGLLGHLMEMCRGSRARGAHLRFDDVPVLSAARHLAEEGYATGASDRNWASCERAGRRCRPTRPRGSRKLLTDPQTSGGLLVACAPGDGARRCWTSSRAKASSARASIGTLASRRAAHRGDFEASVRLISASHESPVRLTS